MIKLKLEPVPYRYQGKVYFYWEYELENPFQLCFVPVPSFNSWLKEIIASSLERLEDLNLLLEDGRIKVWLPVTVYSEGLCSQIEEVLERRMRALLENAMF
ncbi:MAG: hypothetical protein PWP04_1590 [Candidatus Atribacteria bacterium]|nr:hypothetical protein [Candidatus Atribacteria bacterium]